MLLTSQSVKSPKRLICVPGVVVHNLGLASELNNVMMSKKNEIVREKCEI